MHSFELPEIPEQLKWYVVVNTDVEPPEDVWGAGKEKEIENQFEVSVGPRSVMILIGK
jgi:glycogen operon protein